MAINFSDHEKRRYAERHEFRRVSSASAKREKKETVVCRLLLFVSVFCCVLLFGVGGDLLSHNLPVAVPSACAGLASGFGMGPGVSLQLLTTDKHTKHSDPFWVPLLGCCVRYCIVDAVTTVTMILLLTLLLSHTSVLVFVVVN